MSEFENNHKIINFAAKKAEKDLAINKIESRKQYYSSIENDGADLYFLPSLISSLGLDKEPDYIINVDPQQEPDFNFKSGEKWPETPIEDRVEWHRSKLEVGEKYKLHELDLLKVLFGDLLLRCKHLKHVIEVDLLCKPKNDGKNNTFVFEVKVKAIYLESIKEFRCIPEFWYECSQHMNDYLNKHYINKLSTNEAFELNIRFNRTGLFWLTENLFQY